MRRSRRIAALVAGVLIFGGGILSSAVAAPGPVDPDPFAREPAALSSKQMLVTVHPIEWIPLGSNAQLANGLDVSLLSVVAVGEGAAGVAPALPTALDGKRLKLVEVQFCYDANDRNVSMTQFLMRVDRNTTGTTKANPVAAAVSTTVRRDEACRTYRVGWTLSRGDMVAASVTAQFGTLDRHFEIGRLTFLLERTNLAA